MTFHPTVEGQKLEPGVRVVTVRAAVIEGEIMAGEKLMAEVGAERGLKV